MLETVLSHLNAGGAFKDYGDSYKVQSLSTDLQILKKVEETFISD